MHALLHNLGIDSEKPSLLLKRVVTKSGSRCYINANLATLTMLQDIGQHLVDILGQHQYQTLLRREYQLALLDSFGKLSDDIVALGHTYQRYQELTHDLQHLQQEEQQRLQRQDLIQFQTDEIDKAQLHPDEEERLAEERHLLLNAEKLYELSQGAYALLYRNERAVLEMLGLALEHLTQLARLDGRQANLADDVQANYYALEEIAQRLRDYTDRVDVDPSRLQALEESMTEVWTSLGLTPNQRPLRWRSRAGTQELLGLLEPRSYVAENGVGTLGTLECIVHWLLWVDRRFTVEIVRQYLEGSDLSSIVADFEGATR
ncbi:hypothetical protein NKDENANG_02336 [Candidatus Entotheonellaceae bacterium PAL068K]